MVRWFDCFVVLAFFYNFEKNCSMLTYKNSITLLILATSKISLIYKMSYSVRDSDCGSDCGCRECELERQEQDEALDLYAAALDHDDGCRCYHCEWRRKDEEQAAREAQRFQVNMPGMKMPFFVCAKCEKNFKKVVEEGKFLLHWPVGCWCWGLNYNNTMPEYNIIKALEDAISAHHPTAIPTPAPNAPN